MARWASSRVLGLPDIHVWREYSPCCPCRWVIPHMVALGIDCTQKWLEYAWKQRPSTTFCPNYGIVFLIVSAWKRDVLQRVTTTSGDNSTESAFLHFVVKMYSDVRRCLTTLFHPCKLDCRFLMYNRLVLVPPVGIVMPALWDLLPIEGYRKILC